MVDKSDDLRWTEMYPEEKIPGNAEPVDGKCNAKLRQKALRELGITRYCSKSAGYGTKHKGDGHCRWHGGNTPSSVALAHRRAAIREFDSISHELALPERIGPPEVEAVLLVSKMKTWSTFLETKMSELQAMMVTEDKAGVEHVRAIIELLERAWDRLQKALEFLLKYDLRKRIVELTEAQAAGLSDAFLVVISAHELGLSDDQFALARSLFADQIIKLGPAMEPTWMKDVDIIDAEVID